MDVRELRVFLRRLMTLTALVCRRARLRRGLVDLRDINDLLSRLCREYGCQGTLSEDGIERLWRAVAEACPIIAGGYVPMNPSTIRDLLTPILAVLKDVPGRLGELAFDALRTDVSGGARRVQYVVAETRLSRTVPGIAVAYTKGMEKAGEAVTGPRRPLPHPPVSFVHYIGAAGSSMMPDYVERRFPMWERLVGRALEGDREARRIVIEMHAPIHVVGKKRLAQLAEYLCREFPELCDVFRRALRAAITDLR